MPRRPHQRAHRAVAVVIGEPVREATYAERRLSLLAYLLDAKREGRTVAAYGAAAKGNTFLNFAGIRSDMVSFVADRAEAKQDHFMPGSRIPIVSEDELHARRPEYILILPWNLREELMDQLAYARDWGARFVTAIPGLAITP